MKVVEEFSCYDGLLEGICKDNGQFYWFACVEFEQPRQTVERIYNSWAISTEEYMTLRDEEAMDSWEPVVEKIIKRTPSKQITESELSR